MCVWRGGSTALMYHPVLSSKPEPLAGEDVCFIRGAKYLLATLLNPLSKILIYIYLFRIETEQLRGERETPIAQVQLVKLSPAGGDWEFETGSSYTVVCAIKSDLTPLGS